MPLSHKCSKLEARVQKVEGNREGVCKVCSHLGEAKLRGDVEGAAEEATEARPGGVQLAARPEVRQLHHPAGGRGAPPRWGRWGG